MAYRQKAARVAEYVEAENVDVPNVCGACLGPSTHARLLRTPSGKKCHACSTPYASFQWRVAGDARPRFTLMCYACSQQRNLCQSCLCDLATGLAVETRDSLSSEELARIVERKRSMTIEEEASSLAANSSLLERRFQQKPCAFFAKGHCSRGSACPFRHVVAPRVEGQVQARSADVDADVDAPVPSSAPAERNRGGDAHSSILSRIESAPTVAEQRGEATVKDAYLETVAALMLTAPEPAVTAQPMVVVSTVVAAPPVAGAVHAAEAAGFDFSFMDA